MSHRRHTIQRWEWLTAIAVCAVAGAAIAFGRFVPKLVPAWALGLLLIAAGILALVRSVSICRASLRRQTGFSHLGSAVFGIGVLFAVVLPGLQLLAGVRQSRIETLGFPLPNTEPEVAAAFALFLLAMAGFYLGESLVEGPKRSESRRVGGNSARALGRTWESRITYGFLLFIGTALSAIYQSSGQGAFAARGTVTGVGVVQLLSYGAPIAIAIGILNRHWGSRWLMALSILAFAALIPSGIRTPLIIIAAAAAIRSLQSTAHRRIRGRQLLLWGMGIYIAATLLVALSTYRGINNTGGSASLGGQIVAAAGDPFGRLQAQGVDTVDGLILATQVNRHFVGASWTDPSKAILGFIPHQLWPNKPTWLGATVTQAYTNFGAGGIFLSGPGYLLIVYGTAIAIPIGFALLGVFSETLFRRMREPSIWTALLAYFLVRFFFAGDAFDAFHVLGLCLVVIFGRTVAGLVTLLHRPPETRRRVQPST